MILDRKLNIVAATDAYLRAAGLQRDSMIGRSVFEVFPENPDTPQVTATRISWASFEWVLRNNQAHDMPVQRHDTAAPPGADGEFVARFWKPLNSPITGMDGVVRWILHEVKDVTDAFLAADNKAHHNPETAAKRDIIYQLRTANGILDLLPDHLFAPMVRHLRPVSLSRDQVLIEPDKPIETIYFPLEGLISVVRNLADGTSTEVALVGSGGVVGFAAVMGESFDEAEYVALIAGSALVMPVRAFTSLLAAYPDLRSEIARRFGPRLIAELSISAACMAHHSLDQRLARWLLVALARSGETRVPLRQETLAMILGVRRAGVSEAIGKLTAAGILETSRDQITILDRRRLLSRSCDSFEQGEAFRAQAIGPEWAHPLTHKTILDLTARFHGVGEAQPLED